MASWFDRMRYGTRVGLEAMRTAKAPTEDAIADRIDELAAAGNLDEILWESEAIQKEVLGVKNKLKIYRTSHDLYAYHASILRNVVQRYNDKYVLSPHGDPQRDFILAEYWKSEPILAGAVYSMSAKMSTLSWQIHGTKRMATRYANLYSGMLSMNGMGWGDAISVTAQDFYTLDRGSFWITPRTGSHLTGALKEIGVIDALCCAMTGNWRMPVLYQSAVTGQLERLRPGEFAHFASLVSPREEFFGIGLCAVSRAHRAARILLGLSDYDWEKLNNMPPEGVAAVSGLTQDEFQDSLTLWRAARETNKSLTYPQVLWLLGSQPNTTVGLDFIGFSQIPESFDRDKVIEQYVNTLALDFGVDAREFWPISTSSLGTAAESEIQHMKAKGKGPGEFITIIERYLNGEQPDGVEFSFDTQDVGEDMAAATLAKTWIEAFMPLYTGGQQKGALTPNPTRGPGGSKPEPPGTATINKQLPGQPPQPGGGDDKIIDKKQLLRLLIDRGVLPNWIVDDARTMVSDTGIAEKELADIDPDQPIRIVWKAARNGIGKFEYYRTEPIQIHPLTNDSAPTATVMQKEPENGVERKFAGIELESELLVRMKAVADELIEEELERNIRGKPLPAGEALRGPRVTVNSVKAEIERWRKHPLLAQYVPTLEEQQEFQDILNSVEA